ncbi:hypothetical protein JOQ06_020847 [Pogonophryne albipinna]|uniref:Uncharacterized protein n=1 Tax=Pogonophryne albipinna TaxID=1090488 RepID=A0AAD6BS49_9TELE|nr:hypothetical protein JOQ06_020847 [Pogonophryne albipinna]
MVYATHVENPRNFSASIKNVCAGKLQKPGASFTTQDTAARSGEGGKDVWLGFLLILLSFLGFRQGELSSWPDFPSQRCVSGDRTGPRLAAIPHRGPQCRGAGIMVTGYKAHQDPCAPLRGDTWLDTRQNHGQAGHPPAEQPDGQMVAPSSSVRQKK